MKNKFQLNILVTSLVTISLIIISQASLARAISNGNHLINKAKVGKSLKYVPDRLLVAFQPGTGATIMKSIHTLAGAKIIKRIGSDDSGFDLVALQPGSLQKQISFYGKNPNVLYAEPDYIRTINPKPSTTVNASLIQNSNDPFSSYQWALENDGSGSLYIPPGIVDADIDANGGWGKFEDVCDADWGGCIPSTVAVIDTGAHCEDIYDGGGCSFC